jgi:two-component system sensor histidine kinase KdpD
MTSVSIDKIKKYQVLLSLFIIIMLSYGLFFTIPIWGYRIPAFFLLITISLFSLIFDISIVIISTILSALIWNFFFIPPIFTFHITDGEDALMFLIYFVVSLVNSLLIKKIKGLEKISKDKEEKEHAIKFYNTLLNSLSHELKTPVAAIIGAVDTLQENKDQLNEQQKSDLISQIDNAGLRLNREVENLLNLSRLETGTLSLKKDWNDISEVVYQVISKLDTISEKHKIIVDIPDSTPLVKIDRVLVENIIYNILHNALLYTEANTVIHIKAFVINDQLCIEIIDNGKGFAPNDREKAFDIFYRGDKPTKTGTGLGLSIAKGFVEYQNGKIELISEINKGSQFVITIPTEASYLKNLKNE